MGDPNACCGNGVCSNTTSSRTQCICNPESNMTGHFCELASSNKASIMTLAKKAMKSLPDTSNITKISEKQLNLIIDFSSNVIGTGAVDSEMLGTLSTKLADIVGKITDSQTLESTLNTLITM